MGRPQSPFALRNAKMTQATAREDTSAAVVPAANWHAQTAYEAFDALVAVTTALAEEEAAARLRLHGPNEIRSDPGPSAVAVLVRQLRSRLIYALLVSAAVAFALADVADGSVVLAVVVLNALIG